MNGPFILKKLLKSDFEKGPRLRNLALGYSKMPKTRFDYEK